MLTATKNKNSNNIKNKIQIWPLGKEETDADTTKKCTLSKEDITNSEELFKTKVGSKIKMSGHNFTISNGQLKLVISTTATSNMDRL